LRSSRRSALKIWFFALGTLHQEYAMAPRPCLIEDWDISRIRPGANNCEIRTPQSEHF